MGQTITEFLAELKTIEKRIEKKQAFVLQYLVRQNVYRDPLEGEEGGSVGALGRELQAIHDLRERTVAIRRAIASANAHETITLDGQTRPIADWLTWRREVAPKAQGFLTTVSQVVATKRREATQKSLPVVAANAAPGTPQDVIINVNEGDLARQIEQLEKVLGDLDGQLSLKNATIVVDV